MSWIRTRLLDGKLYLCKYKEYLPVKNEISAVGCPVFRGTRIVVPGELRDQVLSLAHEGHPGIVSMKHRLRSKVWWPGIDKQTEKVCKSCHGCQQVGEGCQPEPMCRTDLPSFTWQHLAADLLGPLPSGEHILVVVHYYSRWFEVDFYRKTPDSERVIKSLYSMFLSHGFPFTLQTDNGRQFIIGQFAQYSDDSLIRAPIIRKSR